MANRALKTFTWTVIVLTAAMLVTVGRQGIDWPSLGDVLFWAALLAIIDLLPLALGFGTEVTMAIPIHMAIAIIFPPWVAMAIAGISSIDVREVRREIPLHRALFNRSQLVLAVGAAGAVFQTLGEDLASIPQSHLLRSLAVLAAAALAHVLVNLLLVAAAVHFERRIPLPAALREIPPKPILGFAASYLLLAGLGLAAAIGYLEAGAWLVALVIVPVLFARLSILGARAQQELGERVRKQQEVLLATTERLFQERENERKRIAEDIHDSALQMMAAASYGCSNAQDFMDAGREEDATHAIDTARRAAEGAIVALRESLADLRRSSLEEGGLMDTIANYAQQIATLWGADIRINGRVRREPPVSVGVVAFQILQEGLINALKHSNSDGITVRINDDNGEVHIMVEDRGVGFNIETKVEGHLGMELMRERAERIGGRIEIESTPGIGTRLSAHLPAAVGS